MNIFVSIASYRDKELRDTLDSAFAYADRPDDITYGIVNQCEPNERLIFNQDNVKEIWMPSEDARGAGYARAKAQELYDGEDFFLQIDSHTFFDPGWDTKLLDAYYMATKIENDDKIIISQFPRKYERDDDGRIVLRENSNNYGDGVDNGEISRIGVTVGKKKEIRPHRIEFDSKDTFDPEESKSITAGLVFAPGKIVHEVPYDPEIVFWGEEVTFSMRAWLRGWKFYSPKEWIASHHYLRDENYPRIQDHDKKYKRMDDASTEHQLKIWNEDYLGVWGSPELGGTDKYSKYIDINMKNAYAERDRWMKGHEFENTGVDIMEWVNN